MSTMAIDSDEFYLVNVKKAFNLLYINVGHQHLHGIKRKKIGKPAYIPN